MPSRPRKSALPLLLLLVVSGPLAVCSATRLRGIYDALLASGRVLLPLERTEEGWYAANLSVAGVRARLAVDTGSEVLWLRKALQLGGDLRPKNRSNSSANSVWRFLQPRRFSIQYGRGEVGGEVAEEKVALGGGGGLGPGAAGGGRDCAVGWAADEGGIWARQRSIDGVLGLACSEVAPAAALDCLLPLPDDGDGEEPSATGVQRGGDSGPRTFSLQLSESSGLLTLGPVPDAYRATLVPMPASGRCGHWTAPLLALSVAVGPSSASALPPTQGLLRGPGEAVLDSGTHGIVGPTFEVIALARLLGAEPAPPADGYGGQVTFYRLPCENRITLPPVTLSLGAPGREANVTLKGEDLVGAPAGPDGAQDYCRLQIAGWETGYGGGHGGHGRHNCLCRILGSTFLAKLKATVFDLDRKGVALAL